MYHALIYSLKLHCDNKITNIILQCFSLSPVSTWCLYNWNVFLIYWDLKQGETKVPRCLEKLKYLSIFTGTSWTVKGREEKPPKQTYVSRENVTWQTDLLHLSSGKVHPRLCHMAWVVTVLSWQITGTRGGLWNGSPRRSFKFSFPFSLSSLSIALALTLPISMSLCLSPFFNFKLCSEYPLWT